MRHHEVAQLEWQKCSQRAARSESELEPLQQQVFALSFAFAVSLFVGDARPVVVAVVLWCLGLRGVRVEEAARRPRALAPSLWPRDALGG